jgi:pyruvate formate lyase activating enzyme
VLTGGEPTLQPEACLEISKAAKEMGLSCAVETNGVNSQTLERLLPWLDFVAIDVKAPLSDPKLYSRVAGVSEGTEITRKIWSSLKLATSSGVEVEARTTIVPTLNAREDIVEKIAEEVKDVSRLRLTQFRNQRTFDPEFQKLPMPTRERLLELARVAKAGGLRVGIFTVKNGFEEV